MAVSQDTRLIICTTPLGEDVLLCEDFDGQEALSTPFSFDLRLLSERDDIEGKDLVGQPIALAVVLVDGSSRFFNGVVSRFVRGHRRAGFAVYRAEMVPKLWFLTRKSNCRIFQNETAPDIIEKVLKDAGLKQNEDYKLQVGGGYRQWVYCVQYRETDFNFVSRLMEQEGLYYYFEHSKTGHCMVIVDKPAAHQPCPGQGTARYLTQHATVPDDVINEWSEEYAYRSGKVALDDFNFETPKQDLNVGVDSVVDVGGNKAFELYDQPGEYDNRGEGEKLAKLWIQEEEAQHQVCSGESDCRAFSPGYTVELTDHFYAASNRRYLLRSVGHYGANNYLGNQGPAAAYSNRFTCLPADVPFRAPRLTPKPVVQGPQTAIVVGPKGEEIHTDKYGRVRVQFHWDREHKYDEKSSCFIRVAQTWAGKRWGAMFLPRIGQEVIVEFLEGDPDRPIVTGRVYNADSMPPYDLPAEQTKSAIKSLSSKGGGGFNEIRFEDKKGKEQVFIHAERNQDNRVKKDSLEWVGNNRHLIVKKNQLEKVEGSKHLTVIGDQSEKVSGTFSRNTQMDVQEKVGMKHAVDAGMEIHLKAGMNVVIEGGVGLTIKVGGNHVTINPAGIFIVGTMVMINSGGAALSGSGASPDAAEPPELADTAEPGEKTEVPPPPTEAQKTAWTVAAVQAKTLKAAAQTGTPFCEKCEAARLAAEQGQ
jgi:type VI secretion system secreted protein VgrG